MHKGSKARLDGRHQDLKQSARAGNHQEPPGATRSHSAGQRGAGRAYPAASAQAEGMECPEERHLLPHLEHEEGDALVCACSRQLPQTTEHEAKVAGPRTQECRDLHIHKSEWKGCSEEGRACGFTPACLQHSHCSGNKTCCTDQLLQAAVLPCEPVGRQAQPSPLSRLRHATMIYAR